MALPTLLGISGSLRAGSHNTLILETLAEQVAGKATMDLFHLHDVEPYNQDLDTDTPPPGVAAMYQAMRAADGVILATPEFNHGMSGVLKNALDWGSRPYGNAVLLDKPVMTITASPGALGGVRAQTLLIDVLSCIPCRAIVYPQAVVTFAGSKITDGRLTDEPTLAFLIGNVDRLLAEIARG